MVAKAQRWLTAASAQRGNQHFVGVAGRGVTAHVEAAEISGCARRAGRSALALRCSFTWIAFIRRAWPIAG